MFGRKNRISPSIILFLLSLCWTLSAIDFPKAEDVFRKTIELKTETYPDADVILLTDVQNIKYSSDGTAENVDDVYLKILTEKGRGHNRTLEFHFNNHYQRMKINVAELIKADGKIIPVDVVANSRISVGHEQMGSNIYDPNSKIFTLNIPGLDLGDIIHYRSTETTLKPRMPNSWAEYIMLQSDQPILDYQIEMRSPDKLPLANLAIKDEVKGTMEFTKTKSDGETIYTWHARNVPQVFPEPEMPPLHTKVQRLLVGTVLKWEDISKWYWNLCLPRIEKTTPAMEEEVRKLCEGKDGNDAKIRAIFDFVSQKIRYMGITTENEAPGYEPHDVNITFENRYGVCRDKAALLVAMLRLAGFKAYPVIIMAGPKKDSEVPNPYFNHAITCVEKDDTQMLIDATNETSKELLPSYLCDKSYLIAKPEGDILRTSTIIPASENMLSINTSCEIRTDGSALAETEIVFAGINDNVYRGSLIRKSPEQILDFVEGLARRAHSEAKLESFELLPKKLSDTSCPLSLKLKFHSPGLVVKGTETVAIIFPLLSDEVGLVNFLTDRMGLIKRSFPLCTEIACGVSESLTMRVAPEIANFAKFSLPDIAETDDDCTKWTRKYSFENDAIAYKSDFRLKAVEYSPEQYLKLKKTLGKRESDMRTFLVAGNPSKHIATKTEPALNESGIKVALEDIVIEVNDENSWTTTKTLVAELLDFSGKKDISEIQIHYNEGISDVKLEYAKVISKDGTVKEISQNEINLMDQGWSSSAPRYPPGKILVISLPGVDIGSRVEYKIVEKTSKMPFFCFLDRLRSFNGIARKKITLRNPNGIPIQISQRKDGKLDTHISKTTELEWIFENLPPIRKESNLPPDWTSYDFVAASSGQWGEYYELLTKEISKSASASSAAAQITKDLFGDRELSVKTKILMIRDYVAKNIREAGPHFTELALNSFASADEIFKSAYGTNAEIAAAIVALLDRAGIKYELIPCSAIQYLGPDMQAIEECPQINFLQTILVRLKVDADYIYLNDSNQYSELGIVAHEGTTAINNPKNVDDKKKYSPFFKISPTDEFKNCHQVLMFIKIEKDGSATIRQKETFRGNEYARRKKYMNELTPENLKRFFQELASEISLSALIDGEPKVNFDNYPGEIEITVKTGDFAKFADARMSFVLAAPLKVFERIQSARATPYFNNNALSVKHEYIIALPDEYEEVEIIPPSNTNCEFPLGTSFHASSELIGNNLVLDFFGNAKNFLSIKQSANFAGEIFDGEHYHELLKSSSAFNSTRNSMIVLRRKK